ncbi:MAG: zinc-ribbon domain-containing protein, partial [Deltaproteobacteria bacterium]|nr:zinc-ribbon domain-containing protein [Deltaproteobacteria bacterium]
MDVTCERCGTEYEFDETLLSGRGTSVKCTNCGHVFKVYPRAQEEADRATSSWRLKLKDGSIDTIDTLRELQRRIATGELTPASEIARGEEDWKTLGSIPELETFFQAAGAKVPSRDIRSPLPPSPVPPAPTEKDSSLPPGKRPRQPTLLGVMPVARVIEETGAAAGSAPEAESASVSEPGTEAGSAPEAESASVSEPGTEVEAVSESGTEAVAVTEPGPEPTYQSPYVSPSMPPPAEIEDAEFQEAPRVVSGSSARRSTPPPAYYEDDDDIPELPGRGSSPLRWLLLIVAVGGLALMGTQWERVARLFGIGSDPALIAAGVSEGHAGLAEGHPKAYAGAIEAYGHSIEAGGDRDPEILAGLSHAYALAAQAQIDDGAPGESIESLSAAALTTAQSAVEIEPRDLDAKLALTDALRLAGDIAEARIVLEEARSMSFSRTAEFFRVDARLSAAESNGGLENGLRSAKQAAELAPDGVPYLLLLARAQRAAGEDVDARVPLETILADRPAHPVAAKLMAEIVSAEAEAVADAGVAAEAGTEAAAGTEAETAAETGAETGTAAEAGTEAGTAAGTEAGTATKAVVEKPARERRVPAKKRKASKK